MAVPTISIILPVLNGYNMTMDLIQNISETVAYGDYELILVDDGSTDETSELKSSTPVDRLRVYRHEYNQGFAAACNTGIKEANGKYICIFNNDMIVTPWWDRVLLTGLTQQGKILVGHKPSIIGMVGGQICEPISRGPAKFHISKEEFLEDFMEIPKLESLMKATIEVWHKGAPWMFKREVFDEVGLFDEQFYPGNYEETDLFVRMAIKGFSFGVISSLCTYHISSVTFEEEWGLEGLKEALQTNGQRFLEKWGDNTLPPNFAQALVDGRYGRLT